MQFKKGDIVLVNYKGSKHLTRILDVINASDGNVYYQISGYAYARDNAIEAAEITKEFLLFNRFVDKSTDSVEMYERDTVSVYRVLEKKTDFWTVEVKDKDDGEFVARWPSMYIHQFQACIDTNKHCIDPSFELSFEGEPTSKTVAFPKIELNAACHEQDMRMQVNGFDFPGIPTALMLVVSELTEAMECDRHYKFCQQIPSVRRMDDLNDEQFKLQFEEQVKDTFQDEIADAFLRLMHLCGALNIDIEQFIKLKARYNAMREFKHGGLKY